MLKNVLRKLMSFILAATLVFGTAACGNGGTDHETNTVSSTEDQFEIPEMGIQYTIPKEMLDKGIEVEPYNWNMNDYLLSMISYYYRPITDPLFDQMIEMSEEERKEFEDEFYEKMYAHTRALMCVVMVEKEEYEKKRAEGVSLDEISCFSNTEELGENEGYIYLISIPEYELEGVDEEEKQEFSECHAYMETVKKNIQLTDINEEALAGELPSAIGEFKTVDLDGNEVTESIFAEKDLTVVNIWGTFCSPCIEEMPELGAWAKEMPENVQIIGLVQDISGVDDTEHIELAKQITTKADADFVQLVAGTDDFAGVMASLVGVPTTIFVDSDGNIVGEPIVGAEVESYKNFVEEYLNEQ